MRNTASLLASLTVLVTLACSKPPEQTSEPTPDSGASEAPPADKVACGGFAGTPCPEAMTCVDDPDDDCDPNEGGADCIGVCVADEGAQACDFEADPHKRYVGKSPEQCATMRFACEDGEEYFADDCGCGCLTAEP